MSEIPRDDDLVRLEAAPAARLEGGRKSWRAEEEGEVLPRLRARSVGEQLDLAVEIFRSRFFRYVGIGFLVWLPVRAALSSLDVNQALQSDDLTFVWSRVALAFLLGMLAKTLITSFVALSVYVSVLGTTVGARSVFMYMMRRFPALLLLTSLSTLLVSALCCCFLIPGILMSWKIHVAPVTLVVERGGVGRAISRSFWLTEGAFLRWCGIFAIILVLDRYAELADIGNVPAVRYYLLETVGIARWIYDAAVVVVSVVFLAFSSVLGSVLTVVFYVDCRVRREGYDLALRLRDIRREHEVVEPGVAT